MLKISFNKEIASESEAKTFFEFLSAKDPYNDNYKVVDTIRNYEKRFNPENADSKTIDEVIKQLKETYDLSEYDL